MPYEEQMKRNKHAWDEVTPIHQSYRHGQEEFFRNGGNLLDIVEMQHLPGLKGKEVAHLCCNCGQDTLSLVNLGAKCTGFDISGKAIDEARKLSNMSGVQANFVKSNVLDLPRSYHEKFDIVYLSRGVLVWIPDLKMLMKNAAALLRKDGILFLYDQHPFTHIFDSDSYPLKVAYNYFNKEPEEFRGLDYIGGKTYEASSNYQFMVRLSDLLNGMAENKLNIIKLIEFEHSMFQQFPGMQKREDGLFYFSDEASQPRIPLMLMVKAVKV
jgi:2-polyprenyl-3-methyl-5-hydroxy-6-metoxy-1,4-benzoquinol methylase